MQTRPVWVRQRGRGSLRRSGAIAVAPAFRLRRMRARIGFLVLAILGCLGGAPAASHAASLVQLAPPGSATWPTGAPIHAAAPIGDPRVFVVERGGAVRIVKNGVLQETPFVTVPSVDTTGERGLLSIAFPWDYATTGKFYVFAVIGGAETYVRVLEFKVSSSDPDVADPASQRTVIEQRMDGATNHNGGQLAFSPTDGKLYVTIGDNATAAYARNPEELRGKVLRIDPTDPDGVGPLTYTVPSDNPTWQITGPSPRSVQNAVWAIGLRNPYRAAFSADGRLVIGDVGQGTTEEIDLGASGADFGWSPCEGPCVTPTPAYTDPRYWYTNDASTCAVIGGIVVRDASLAGLTGRYLFADLCERALRTISLDGAVDHQTVGLSTLGAVYTLYSFGEDARGCVYIADGGTLYRLAPNAGDPKACGQPFLPAPPATPKPAEPTNPGTGTGGGGTTTPGNGTGATPTPTTPKPTTPTGPTKVVYPRNCTRDGRISIKVTGGKVTTVKLVRGKKTKTLKFKRTSGRLNLDGVPKAGNAKLRISVKLKSGKTKKVDKTYKPCRA